MSCEYLAVEPDVPEDVVFLVHLEVLLEAVDQLRLPAAVEQLVAQLEAAAPVQLHVALRLLRVHPPRLALQHTQDQLVVVPRTHVVLLS